VPRFDSFRQLAGRLTAYPWWEVAVELGIIFAIAWIVWRFVQGTRAAGALKGILLLVVATLALRLAAPPGAFERLAFLYDNFLAFAAIAAVIIFQPELRRALIRLGETRLFRSAGSDVTPIVDAIVSACRFLSKNKFGAIIAIERRVGLRETVEGGRIINADVSSELLQTIFWPNSPLHDMGVVIRDGRIVGAGVQFPLAEPFEMTDPRLGTRHRAAVGLTRVTDALVIVVSEETGGISLAERGKLDRWLSPETLGEEIVKRIAAAAEGALSAEEPADEPVSGGSDEQKGEAA